jgi:hypothetical protein
MIQRQNIEPSLMRSNHPGVPTPAGLTPRQLQNGLVQIEPTKERRE